MQHNMYAVGDQLRVKRSEWTVMIFFQKKQHIDYIEMIDQSFDQLINRSILTTFLLPLKAPYLLLLQSQDPADSSCLTSWSGCSAPHPVQFSVLLSG